MFKIEKIHVFVFVLSFGFINHFLLGKENMFFKMTLGITYIIYKRYFFKGLTSKFMLSKPPGRRMVRKCYALELKTNLREVFKITEKAPTGA